MNRPPIHHAEYHVAPYISMLGLLVLFMKIALFISLQVNTRIIYNKFITSSSVNRAFAGQSQGRVFSARHISFIFTFVCVLYIGRSLFRSNLVHCQTVFSLKNKLSVDLEKINIIWLSLRLSKAFPFPTVS